MQDNRAVITDSHTLFEGAPCGLIVTRENGTILRANATFCQWTGFSEPELQARRFQDLLTMGGRIFHQTHWAPLMKMQGSVAEVKLDLVHRDGHSVTLLLNAIRRKGHAGPQYELAAFAIIDRDKYERELLNARKLAEALLREKTQAQAALTEAQAKLSEAYEDARRRASFAEQMIAIVSHDLKNPLTAVKMASGLLARGEPNSRARLLLDDINQSTDRAVRMIDDLLDFTLVRVGRAIAITPATVDLHPLVERAVGELGMTFPDVVLQHQFYGAGTVHADADRLQQVIGNLVGNAVTYGDTTKPVTVTSRVGDEGFSVAVHNWGAVIPEPVMSELFEPMTRGTDVGTRARSVGLGLFIVREIAKAHGGNVQVSSAAQSGTVFTVCFPHDGVAAEQSS